MEACSHTKVLDSKDKAKNAFRQINSASADGIISANLTLTGIYLSGVSGRVSASVPRPEQFFKAWINSFVSLPTPCIQSQAIFGGKKRKTKSSDSSYYEMHMTCSCCVCKNR